MNRIVICSVYALFVLGCSVSLDAHYQQKQADDPAVVQAAPPDPPFVPPAPSAWPRYCYTARLVSVHDGDTARLSVDLGFGVIAEPNIRFIGWNSPELSGPHREEAKAAKQALADILANRVLYLVTKKDQQSFARYLATVYVDQGGRLTDVAELMKAKGYDVPQGD